MGWNKGTYKYKWNHQSIDQEKLHASVKKVRDICKPHVAVDREYGLLLHHVVAVEEGAKQGSILIDISYNAAFEIIERYPDEPKYEELQLAMEEIYDIIDLGTLTQDHIERERKEKAWMIKKGFRNG